MSWISMKHIRDKKKKKMEQNNPGMTMVWKHKILLFPLERNKLTLYFGKISVQIPLNHKSNWLCILIFLHKTCAGI